MIETLQIALLVVLLAVELYNMRLDREIVRRLDQLLDDHGQRPVEKPLDQFAGPRRVMEGIARHVRRTAR